MNNFRKLLTFSVRYFYSQCYKFSSFNGNIRTITVFNNFNHTTIQHPCQITRGYAKGKDKKKEKGKSKVIINENELQELINVDNFKKHLEKPLELMKSEYVKQLSLRTSANSLELLTVNHSGKDYSLQEIAQIVRKNPTMFIIQMTVFPQAIPDVIKALQKSNFNLNPQQEGTTLYVPVPKVTQEYRESLTKVAKQLFVKCKDAMRDVQTKQTKSIKKKDKVSEDLIRNVQQQIIALTDEYIKEAESVFNSKCNELLGK